MSTSSRSCELSPLGPRTRTDQPTDDASPTAHSALNIVKPEGHGSFFRGEVKEGASLFGMMDICKTVMGKARLRSWMLRPSLVIETIEQRQNAIECLRKPMNCQSHDDQHHSRDRC